MARDFPGSGGEGVVHTAIAAQDGFTQLTASVWYQRTAGGGEFGYGRQFTKDPYWQFINNNGDVGWGINFEFKWTGSTAIWSTDYPSNGVWVHDCVTYDATSTANDPIYYRNGSPITTTERTAPSGSASTDTSEFYIGRSQDGTEWDGAVAECAYWNRILTAAEVAALAKGLCPLRLPANLEFYSPVDGRNSPGRDLVGGTSGTVTGTSNFTHPRIFM